MKSRLHKPWTESDEARMRAIAKKGESARVAATKLGRTRGSVAFKAMKLGISFSSVRQPAGVQKRRRHERAAA